TPVVIRFPQILDAAVKELNEAFLRAIKEYEYDGVFRGVFPIKVNQKKIVVKEIIQSGRKYGYGLEAGSKPELLAALSQDLGSDCLITTDVAKKRGVKPLIGMRSKLYARGSGKWAKSGGEAAKFGLTTTEMLEAVEIL